MAKMSVIYKINVEQDKLAQVKEALKEIGAEEVKEEPIGFGIVVLKALFILPEDASMDELEEKISQIEVVSSIDVDSMNRLG
ncbi:MAG: hypothetical protein GXN92_00475 [Candidatus Micrarchaeota archaeon]|nr:hypothetical protein [Candidatus Micrarchaeota archaeon]